MQLWDKIRGYLQLGSNRRKVLIGGVAVLAVVGLVIAGINIGDLLSRTPTRASIDSDLTRVWKTLPAGPADRAHAKSIVVEQEGKHWLYVVGGLETKTGSDGKLHSQLLKTVDRVEVNPLDGSPVANAQWQSMVTGMNSGHAEFGILNPIVNGKPYIYVVAGDAHIPTIPAGSELTQVPLLYSTIERLDLSASNAQWEFVSTVTGVNFYPEVAMFDSRLNIVGGVYGNPFTDTSSNCSNAKSYGNGTSPGPNNGVVTDPINPTEDAGLWNQTKNLPNIGPNRPILLVTDTGHTPYLNDVIEPAPGLEPQPGSGSGLQPGLTSSSRIKQLFAGIFHKVNGAVPRAEAQSSGGMAVTSPQAGVVLQPGKQYPIVVEHIAAKTHGWLGLSYSTTGPTGPWTFIEGSSQEIFMDVSRLAYNWTVPNVKSTNVYVQAKLNYDGTYGSDIAVSGQFAIGTSLAHQFSLELLSGDFVTTVSEYYAINLASSNVSTGALISELGNVNSINDTNLNDYEGTLPVNPIWEPGGKVMRLGHLRFTTIPVSTDLLTPPTYRDYQKIVPVAQGRYGHKLIIDSSNLLVVGGASWMPKIHLDWHEESLGNNLEYLQTTRYFWVIENTPFPSYAKDGMNDKRLLLGSGGYIGHIAYSLSTGSNFWSPSTTYSFRSSDDTDTKGRAFFGLAKSGEEWTLVGGLENVDNQYKIDDTSAYMRSVVYGGNGPANVTWYEGGILIQVTGRTIGLQSAGWTERDPYVNNTKVYNLSVFGLNDRMVAYGGQTQFSCSITSEDGALTIRFVGDPHVPDPAQPISNVTALYRKSADANSWNQMADIGKGTDGNAHPENGIPNVIFSAETVAAGTDAGISTNDFYIYRYGGFQVGSGNTLTPIIKDFQGLGFTDAGIPDQQESSINSDKAQVIADSLDRAIVTVTLKDKFKTPLPGFSVALTTNRNVGGSNSVDIIHNLAPTNGVTDANGQATFTVASSTKGLSTITGVYANSPEDLANHRIVPITDSETIRFVGKIISLIPDGAAQGETTPLSATGQQTSWIGEGENKTSVSFTAPASISVTSDRGSILDANGLSVTPLQIVVANKPNTSVKLIIQNSEDQGWGSFLPRLQAGVDRKTIDVTTNAEGKATVNYQHGSRTGVVDLKAEVAGGETRDKLKLVLANLGNSTSGLNPFEVVVNADPNPLTGEIKTSNVTAMLYRYTAEGKKRITDPSVAVNFYVDDHGTLSRLQDNIDATKETAETAYTRGSQIGDRQVFATVSYQGFFTAGVVTIGDSAITNGITFDSNGLSINSSSQTIAITTVVIDPLASIGFWNFVTSTKIGGDATNPEFETISHPFQVIPAGAEFTPQIVSITPEFVNAPSDNYEVNIEGLYTHFDQDSTSVTFTHASDPNGSGITFTPADVTVTSPTGIKVIIDVAGTATIGYWNVKVDTNNGIRGHEVAEKAGNTDFLVTAASGYQFVITASPNELFRDGMGVAQLTTKVGKIDNATGQVTPLDGVKLTYGLEGGTGGTLQKNGIDSDTTHDGGYSFNTYTTDKGSESAEIYIRVSGTVDNVPLTARVMILRKVADGDYITLVANPTSLPLAGTPDTSLLTATAVGADGQPLPNGTVMSFLIVEGPGVINPAGSNTSGGKATATYYRPGSLTLPTTVKAVAKATIPNVGTVFSNQVLINIGANNSDYNITLTTDKSSVSVGGSDKAKLTATLTYKGTAMNRYPINFSILEGRNGDYLTILSGRTNTQGKIETEFAAGIFPGNIMVVATPLGLQSAFVPITKVADQTIDPRLSTISVVPAYLPADNTATGLVTVTLRNSQFTPLSGKSVTIASDRTADTLSPTGAQLTDSTGRAFFTIRSGQLGTSNVKATIGTLIIGPAQAIFENPASLVSATLDIKVPLEAKAYNREIKFYVREKNTGMIPVINEVYFNDPATDKLLGIPTTIYFHPNQPYGFWVKGRYHLARINDFTSPSTSGTTITLDFTESGKGLYIADLSSGDASEVFPGFNDNKINTIDIAVISASWFKNSYLADFNSDFVVNTIDIAYWAANWFHNPGAPLP